MNDFQFFQCSCVMTSCVMTLCHDVTKTASPISGYGFARKMILPIHDFVVFLVAYLENVSDHVFVG